MASRFPDSPWTPKGLLAAILLGHPAADSLRGLLAGRYAASPYAAVLTARPDRPAEYAALEDSLDRALRASPALPGSMRNAQAPALRPGQQPNQPARPTTRPTIDP